MFDQHTEEPPSAIKRRRRTLKRTEAGRELGIVKKRGPGRDPGPGSGIRFCQRSNEIGNAGALTVLILHNISHTAQAHRQRISRGPDCAFFRLLCLLALWREVDR